MSDYEDTARIMEEMYARVGYTRVTLEPEALRLLADSGAHVIMRGQMMSMDTTLQDEYEESLHIYDHVSSEYVTGLDEDDDD